MKKKAIHYTAPYLLAPMHPITVSLIGCGGNGSQMLSGLARMHTALKALGHPGLMVLAYDYDRVSEANVGRQMFSPADIGLQKSVVLISRINRFFGTDWGARGKYTSSAINKDGFSNILISCVDTAATRIEISKMKSKKKGDRFNEPFYWLDLGNKQNTGQVVLGTMKTIKGNTIEGSIAEKLPNVVKMFPKMGKGGKKDDQGPSCSLAEALNRQDLFINSAVSQVALALLWKLFRNGKIQYHGAFINLETLNVNPIPIYA